VVAAEGALSLTIAYPPADRARLARQLSVVAAGFGAMLLGWWLLRQAGR
jgi:hypothetical protein